MAIVEREDYFNARLSCRADLTILQTIKDRLSKDNNLRFKKSCFGQFYNFQNIPFQGQLYLHLLFKQDKTMKGDSLVFHVNNGEAQFGPMEFALVTGLKFGAKPIIPENSKFYKAVFGKKNVLYVRDIEDAFIHAAEAGDHVEPDVILKLALLWVLYGILLMKDNTTKRIDVQYIHLCDDLVGFNKYPWGRVAYDFLRWDIRTTMGEKATARRERHRGHRAKQNVAHIDIYGFAYALQIWAYEAIPCVGTLCGGKRPTGTGVIPRMLRWSPTKAFRFEELTTHCFPILELGDEIAERIKVRASLSPTNAEKKTPYYVSLVDWEEGFNKSTGLKSTPMTRKRKRQEADTKCDEGSGGSNTALLKELIKKYKSMEKHMRVIIENQKLIMDKLGIDDGQEDINNDIKVGGEEQKHKNDTREGFEGDIAGGNEDKLDGDDDGRDTEMDGGIEISEHGEDDNNGGDEEMEGGVESKEHGINEKDGWKAEDDEKKNEQRDGEAEDAEKKNEQKDGEERDGEKNHGDEWAMVLESKSDGGQGKANGGGENTDVGDEEQEATGEDDEFEEWYNNDGQQGAKVQVSVENIGVVDYTWFRSIRDPLGWLTSENLDAVLNLLVVKAKTWPSNFQTGWTCVDVMFWDEVQAIMTERVYNAWKKADNNHMPWIWETKEKLVVDYVNGRLPLHGIGKPWKEVERVFGLGHVNQNHWVLYELSLQDECIIVYDSQSSGGRRSNPRHLSKVRLLASLMPSICDQLVKTSPSKSIRQMKKAWDVKVSPDAPQQVDSSSCGVVAMKMLECLVSGRPPNAFDPRRQEAYRKMYCSELFDISIIEGTCLF